MLELLSRDPEDGRATWQPQSVGSEPCLNGTSQVPTLEDARKDGHIGGRSKRFMRHPGLVKEENQWLKRKKKLPSFA